MERILQNIVSFPCIPYCFKFLCPSLTSHEILVTLSKTDTIFIFAPLVATNRTRFLAIFGVAATNLVFILCARVKTLRDMGGCMSPFNAFQLIQGVETLSLRAKAHSENANALAEWLSTHPMVKQGSVMHPSLPSHPSHENAKKYFRDGCFGSVFCFELKGDTPEQERARGETFIDNVTMFAHLANVGDARTLVIHPSSTTHQQLTPEEQSNAGVYPASVRVSVGYEDFADIKLDFERAFEKAAAV